MILLRDVFERGLYWVLFTVSLPGILVGRPDNLLLIFRSSKRYE